MAYKKARSSRASGAYGESDDITGGMGLKAWWSSTSSSTGRRADHAGRGELFPAEFGIASTVDAARPRAQFYAPGPIVEAEILKPANPIFYGYSKDVPVRYANGPLLRVPKRDRKHRS